MPRKKVLGFLATDARVQPDLRFPGDLMLTARPQSERNRPDEQHSESRKDSEEERSGSSSKSEPERHREPEKAALAPKEKTPDKEKAPEVKPQQPQRQIQRAITGGGGPSCGENKEAGGSSSAERAENVKKMSEQFQVSPGKPEVQRNAPLMTPLPGQNAPAKETAKATPESNTPPNETRASATAERSTGVAASPKTEMSASKTESASKSESTVKSEGPVRAEGKSESSEKGKGESGSSKAEGAKGENAPQEGVRRERVAPTVREIDPGEDFTGMRRSAGYQQAKTEMDYRQQTTGTPREAQTPEQGSERRPSQPSQSTSGDAEGRGGNQEKPGEEMQQRSDRGERQQGRRHNNQSQFEKELEEEEALLAESEERS